MRLPDLVQKIKTALWHCPDIPRGIFLVIFLFLLLSGVFLIERVLSDENDRKAELRITQFETTGAGEGSYVASKNGTAYYLPWCGGVRLIREENRIWFASKKEAETKGFSPAGNCKGI